MSAIDPIAAGEPESQTADLVAENLAALKLLFPQAFGEGGVDFDVLRQLLGDAVDDGDERYGLNWSGKRQARRLALMPSLGTLRPAKDDSVNWDTTKNLMIEGDNLEVLKLLQKSYAGQIKLIYIDPPYNTGNDFVYPDEYADNLANYLRRTAQVDSRGVKNTSNVESGGRYHTDWLNMMMPRLMLAQKLLSDEGILAVSCDDHEFANLKMLCDSIFGGDEFVASLIWNKQHSQQQGMFKRYHEYIFLFARNTDYIGPISGGEGFIEAGALKKISRSNPASDFEFPAGVRFDAPDGTKLQGTFGDSEKVTVVAGALKAQGGRTAEPVTLSAGWTQKNQMKSWFAGQETLDTRGQKVLEFYFSSTGKLKCRKERGRLTPPTILPPYGMVSEQTSKLVDLMGADVFSNPKPVAMISDFVDWFTGDNDIVLDFFAGSGTTGHAVLDRNAIDGCGRRYILVQLPEPLDPTNTDQKTAAAFCDSLGKPRTIAELTKERLRRAAAKVKADNPSADFDDGFRAYKLATSNLKAWAARSDDLQADLESAIDNLVPGRTEDDLLVELLLKQGIDLTEAMVTRQVAGREVHAFGHGAMVACLADVSKADAEALANGIADWVEELSPPNATTFFFKDSGFEDNRAKANLAAILEQRLGDRLLKVRSL